MTAGIVHVRISRLSVDAAVLGGSPKGRFADRLEQAIGRRLAGTAADGRDGLIDGVADDIAARLAESGQLPRDALPRDGLPPMPGAQR